MPRLIAVLAALLAAAPALAGDLPDPTLTPGAVVAGVTAAEVCRPGWAHQHRRVTARTRKAVLAAYGLSGPHDGFCARGCELDHLIPLELGGANTAANLWPEQLSGARGARKKDRLENRLHALVCAGELDLMEAQKAIATDWLAAYRRFVGRP